jgi:hypothetical protein
MLAFAHDEVTAILEEVDRFAARAIEPLVRQPETPMSSATLGALLSDARSLGIVAGDEETGTGLWEGSAPSDVSRSVQVLMRLACANAGFALAAHRESLARWIARRIGTSAAGVGVAAVQGRFGLGRHAVARYVGGATMGDDDRAIMADYYAPSHERLLTVHTGFDWLLAPSADASGDVHWVPYARESLELRAIEHVHGFDELSTLTFRPRGPASDGAASEFDSATSAAHLAAALALESLALLAIATGAARRGHRLARAYASTRAQGGRPIDRHPAVQLLLASSRSAIDTAAAQLESVAQRGLSAAGLQVILSARAESHPLLCRAANDALQVFGGAGYMRDTGLEKIVRDENHLRVLCGSPPEASLFVAELERLHG